MANALPHAIGVQIGNPGRHVISMSGDGGLGMLMGELLTVLEMLVDGLPDYETDHNAVDFSAIAAGVGIHAIRVEKPGDLRSALADGLAHPGPALATDPGVG